MITIQDKLKIKHKEWIVDLEFREHQRVTIQEIAQVAGVNRITLSKKWLTLMGPTCG